MHEGPIVCEVATSASWASLRGRDGALLVSTHLEGLLVVAKAYFDLDAEDAAVPEMSVYEEITTPEGRDAVPAGGMVRSADGTIACRHPSGVGVVFGDERPFDWSVLRLPLTVIDPDRTAPPVAQDRAGVTSEVLAWASSLGFEISLAQAEQLVDAILG